MKKIAFVTPWYGEKIPGGAEAELRGLVHHLQDAGIALEILTTCAKEFASNWNVNAYVPKTYIEAGICVRRFPVRPGNREKFDTLNKYLLRGVRLTAKEEEDFFENSIHSDELYEYIRNHQEEYQWFVYIPYLYGTTCGGVSACPQKAIMIPCLHDESYARTSTVKRIMESLSGIIFHAGPEQELANKRYRLANTRQAVLGEGVDTDWQADANRFRTKYQITEPFLLYAGRKDSTKNVDTLLHYFARYQSERAGTGLKLVMIGPASIEIPESVRKDVVDLGFVDRQDKYDAYAAATALCQPSRNESFSLVIMESWWAERPVLVHQECAVTSGFVSASNGGFYFGCYEEFAQEVDYLTGHPEIAARLGIQGKQYVMTHFTWDVIVKTYREFFENGGIG